MTFDSNSVPKPEYKVNDIVCVLMTLDDPNIVGRVTRRFYDPDMSIGVWYYNVTNCYLTPTESMMRPATQSECAKYDIKGDVFN